jgi:hypothetical protein
MTILQHSDVVAVDLDGTLADDTVISMTDYRHDVIGKPIQLTVDRIKAWLASGRQVVIFTARVHPKHGATGVALAEKAINEWCMNVFGRTFEVTSMKDPMFSEIWDDKAVKVVHNAGTISAQFDVHDPLDESDQIGAFLGD